MLTLYLKSNHNFSKFDELIATLKQSFFLNDSKFFYFALLIANATEVHVELVETKSAID